MSTSLALPNYATLDVSNPASLAGFGGNYPIAPAIGTPAPSSLDSGGDGGILNSLGSDIQGLSNIGLQWFTAVTKGVSGPLVTPQPVQATSQAATATILNQLTGYLPLILLALAAVFIISRLLGKR